MNHLRAGLLACVMGALLAACGSKPSPPPENPTAPLPASVSNSPAAPPQAATAPKVAATTENQEAAPAVAATPPPKGLSEVDDDSESVEDAASAAKSVSVLTEPSIGAAGSGVSHFKEGTHYQRLATTQPTTAIPGHIEVAEVFWYGCGHCYALDPALESWRQRQKPPYVDFVRIPAMWNETLKAHARLFYTAQVLGRLDELHTAIFRAIQLEGNQLTTEEKAGFFFRSHGASDNDFRQTYNSSGVQALLNQADQLNRRYRIQSVPTLIVNGRYMTDIGMAGGQEQLIALVTELAAREHGR